MPPKVNNGPKKGRNRNTDPVAVEIKGDQDNENVCVFCGKGRTTFARDLVKSGGFYMLGDLYLHYFCVLFTAGDRIKQKGTDEQGLFGFSYQDIVKELKRLDDQDEEGDSCQYCSGGRANAECSAKNCQSKFHFPCGVVNDCAFLFCGEFNAYCRDHRPEQKKSVVSKASEDRTCVAGCMDEVDKRQRRVFKG